LNLQTRDDYAAACARWRNFDDPHSGFQIVDGKTKMKKEHVPRVPASFRPKEGTVLNVSQATAMIEAVAEMNPLTDVDGNVVKLPGTEGPVMESQALYFLSEVYPVLLLLARPLLALHASFNGCAVNLLGAPLDILQPNTLRDTHFVRVNVCEECPGERCAPRCRFAAVQDYFDDAQKMHAARTERRDAFIAQAPGEMPWMGNPLRPVRGSRDGQSSSHTLTYAQNMQILCEARENMSLHNRKTLDPEQQQFNGDVINMFAAVHRTLDKLTRDFLRPDKASYDQYAVCKKMWSDGYTDVCHPWGEPSIILTAEEVDNKFRPAATTPATPRNLKRAAASGKGKNKEPDSPGEEESPSPQKSKRAKKSSSAKTRGRS
jgi:hypothetical protein